MRLTSGSRRATASSGRCNLATYFCSSSRARTRPSWVARFLVMPRSRRYRWPGMHSDRRTVTSRLPTCARPSQSSAIGPPPLGPREDPVIGCRILTEPFFWPRDLWIPVPNSFSRNTVVGKEYSADTADGLRLWQAVNERLAATPAVPRPVDGDRYGQPVLMRQCLGVRLRR